MTLAGIVLRKIGVVRSDVKERKDMPLQGVDATVEVFPEFEEALAGLDGHSHVFVLCWLHQAERDLLKVTPRKFSPDLPERGVFSVRSPVRPNPVSLTASEIISRDGRFLRVANLDVIDGTPVIDIKPYEPGWDCIFAARDHDRTEKLRKMLPAEVREDLLREAMNYHGERCTGLALAVRMAVFAGQRLGCDLRREDVCVLIGKNHCISDSLIGITGARLGNSRLYYNLSPKTTKSKDSYSIYNAEKTIVFRRRRFMKDFDSILDCNINDLFDIEVIQGIVSEADGMKKAVIFYFSESGNTEKVAIAIYEKLEKAGYAVEPVCYSDREDLPAAADGVDLFAVGFPTFFGYPPKFISGVLKGLNKVHQTDAIVFTTYGGTTAGDSLYEAASILASKGYRILGGLKIEGSDDYPQGRDLGINKGRPDTEDLKAVRTFVDLVLEAKDNGRHVQPEKLASTTSFFQENRGKPRRSLISRMRKPLEGKIVFDPKQCIFCVTCIQSCPTKSITKGKRTPEFNWKCIDGVRCYQCVRACPGKAFTVKYPLPVEEYGKYRALAADSPGEKMRRYIVAGKMSEG